MKLHNDLSPPMVQAVEIIPPADYQESLAWANLDMAYQLASFKAGQQSVPVSEAGKEIPPLPDPPAPEPAVCQPPISY